MKTTAAAIGGALLAALGASSAGAATLDIGHDINARGAKPAWSLTVTHGTDFALNRPGKPPLVAKAPGAAISAGGASWTAKTADGRPMKVTIQSRACTLDKSQYPLTAQVELGSETLSGCAANGR